MGELQKRIRREIRRSISKHEYEDRNRGRNLAKYRSTEKGKAAVKRQNDKRSKKDKLFKLLYKKLENINFDEF